MNGGGQIQSTQDQQLLLNSSMTDHDRSQNVGTRMQLARGPVAISLVPSSKTHVSKSTIKDIYLRAISKIAELPPLGPCAILSLYAHMKKDTKAPPLNCRPWIGTRKFSRGTNVHLDARTIGPPPPPHTSIRAGRGAREPCRTRRTVGRTNPAAPSEYLHSVNRSLRPWRRHGSTWLQKQLFFAGDSEHWPLGTGRMQNFNDIPRELGRARPVRRLEPRS